MKVLALSLTFIALFTIAYKEEAVAMPYFNLKKQTNSAVITNNKNKALQLSKI
jgi:hypothetical protein